jgi:hypothetical protein
MRADTLKLIQLIDENKYTIAQVLKKGSVCEIEKAPNGLKVSEVKKTVRR